MNLSLSTSIHIGLHAEILRTVLPHEGQTYESDVCMADSGIEKETYSVCHRGNRG